MSVSNRILAGFGALVLILIVLGLYSIGQIGAVRGTVDRIVARDIATMNLLTDVQGASAQMAEARTTALGNFTTGGGSSAAAAAAWRDHARTAEQGLARLDMMIADYRESSASAERGTHWGEMGGEVRQARAALGAVRDLVEAQLRAVAAGDRQAALAAEPAIAASRAALLRSLADLRETLGQTVAAGREAGEDVYDRSRLSILIGLIVAAIASLAVALAIRRSIIRPLDEFVGFTKRVGEGDLSGAAMAVRGDEIGQLGTTLNEMVAALRSLARQSRDATENLNAAATEIRASTQEQAASVEQQLAAVQETAATVDEITHSGSQISRRAQEVITAAQTAARTSEAGIAAVDDTVRAMASIRDQAEAVATNIIGLSGQAQAIGEIIATVNDVSERSHLLALNASIEAAAAGEAGQRFAVVAAELKTLADQAKDATRQVRGQLNDIQRGINASVMLTEEAVKRADAGTARTDAAQSAIDEMSQRIQESVQTFQQIVASTNQQQIGIEQVTIALQNIRQASQQTAASTRQLDQAAGDLSGLAGTLLTMTDRYRL